MDLYNFQFRIGKIQLRVKEPNNLVFPLPLAVEIRFPGVQPLREEFIFNGDETKFDPGQNATLIYKPNQGDELHIVLLRSLSEQVVGECVVPAAQCFTCLHPEGGCDCCEASFILKDEDEETVGSVELHATVTRLGPFFVEPSIEPDPVTDENSMLMEKAPIAKPRAAGDESHHTLSFRTHDSQPMIVQLKVPKKPPVRVLPPYQEHVLVQTDKASAPGKKKGAKKKK